MRAFISKTWLFPVILSLTGIALALSPLVLSLGRLSIYSFFRVPFASWYVFVLSGAILILTGVILYLWWVSRRSFAEIAMLRREPIQGEIPAVLGHKCLDRAEFLSVVQSLFGRFPGVRAIRVNSLPGGYGGGETVLVKLDEAQGTLPIPRSFVVKLGGKREMAEEREKFERFVYGRLARAPQLYSYAEWEDYAGLAYEFAGLDMDDEVQSLSQFYAGHTGVEITKIVDEVYSHLGRAWYGKKRTVSVSLRHEYAMLREKRDTIVRAVEGLVDDSDVYWRHLANGEAQTSPSAKPGFCPPVAVAWYDPVTFLVQWDAGHERVRIKRSVVHGDLHARNILIEVARDGPKLVWFIDFSHTGNGLSAARTKQLQRDGIEIDDRGGHTLRDFARLESETKFILTQLRDERDLARAVAFEGELMAQGMTLPDLRMSSLSDDILLDDRFRKAWQVIREIRALARNYIVDKDDLRPYYFSLLGATLPTVYYQRAQFNSEQYELQQKRYAFLAAGMLCARLR